jgi:hypothetical protein
MPIGWIRLYSRTGWAYKWWRVIWHQRSVLGISGWRGQIYQPPHLPLYTHTHAADPTQHTWEFECRVWSIYGVKCDKSLLPIFWLCLFSLFFFFFCVSVCVCVYLYILIIRATIYMNTLVRPSGQENTCAAGIDVRKSTWTQLLLWLSLENK